MTKKLALLITLSSIVIFQLTTTSIAIAQETVATPSEITNIKNEGFTIIPAEPNSINEREFIFEIAPGSETRDSVLVRNLSSTEATFLLYGADGAVSAQGTQAYKTRDAESNGEGKWITFDHPQIVLGPNEYKKEYFTLRNPKEAEIGDHRAGIAIEKNKKDSQNTNITIATRVILHSKIKVTENPMPVPKAGITTSPAKNTWQIYYFWISLFLFIGSFIALIWVTYQEKKAAPNVATKSPAITAKKPTRKSPRKSNKHQPKAK